MAIEDREVLRRVHRDAGERRLRLGHRRARLQHVAHDDRDAEAVADVAPPAEGERDREAVGVDAVEQPPEAVAHADHAPARPRGRGDHALQPRGRVVVVADEHRRVAAAGTLRAADDEPRRTVEGEHPRGQLVAVRQLHQAVVRRDQLGHVALQRAAAGLEARAGRLALLQVPRPVRGPHGAQPRLPLRSGLQLLDRLEDQLLGARGQGRCGRGAVVLRKQLELVAQRLPHGRPPAVDRLGGLGRKAARDHPLGQVAQVGLVGHRVRAYEPAPRRPADVPAPHVRPARRSGRR